MASDIFPEHSPKQRKLVLWACVAALFTASVESTIVATAMPTITADLGGFSLLAWVFAAYMLTQSVTIPIYGRLADIYGRKRVLFFGFGLFLIGCVLCGFAPSMLMLVIFRAIQGIGAGAVIPVTLTIVGDTFPSVERARVQPFIASTFATASIIGPMLGAFIVQHLSWQLIFWLNVPLGLIAVAMLTVFYKETPRVVKHTLDITGALLLMASITCALLAMLQFIELGWWIILLVAASAVFFFLFLRVERRSAEPLLPPELWRDSTLLVSNVGNLGIGAALMGVAAFVPTYVQGVMHAPVLVAGLILTVFSFSWPFSSSISARVMMQNTYRTTAVFGAGFLTLGSAMIAILASLPPSVNSQILRGWWPAVGVFFIGAGLGAINTPFHISMQEAAVSLRGIATATQQFMRMAGGTFGTALLGMVLNLSLASKAPQIHDPAQTLMDETSRANMPAAELQTLVLVVGESLSNVFWVLAFIALLTAITAFYIPKVQPGKLREYIKAP
jgi:EmrB/QacA subfamily drug resistance transporter